MLLSNSMKPTIPPTTLYTCVKDRKSFFLAFFLILISITSSYAQPTFFGVSSTPVDGGAQPGPTAILVPPALMQAGDLVIIYGQYAASSAALSISVTGGQTWNSGAVYTTGGSNQSIFISWCRFNGTWTLNPVVSGPGVVGLTAIMYVYRPSSPSSLWGVNVAQLNANTSTEAQTLP